MVLRLVQMLGITSTHVENTVSKMQQTTLAKDHLHTRGEYQKLLKTYQLKIGSPPHTWRIPEIAKDVPAEDRITSTHVENTIHP